MLTRPRIPLFPILAALFVGLPLVDLIVVALLAKYLTLPVTILLVILSGFVGAGLAKKQGLKVWTEIQRDWAEGRIPAQGLMDSVIILFAGGLLAAPGFITDLIGLALLFPQVRAPIKERLRRALEGRVSQHFGMERPER